MIMHVIVRAILVEILQLSNLFENYVIARTIVQKFPVPAGDKFTPNINGILEIVSARVISHVI